MAGEAAQTKVATALHAWLDGHLGAGVVLSLNRPADESYQDDEDACVNIRFPQTSYSIFNYGSWLHSGDVMFDIIVRSNPAGTIGAEVNEIAASIVSRISARVATTPGEFGDIVTDAVPVAMGQPGEDQMMSDHGEVIFAWRITWQTPENDFRTVIGHSGPIA